MSVVRDIKSQYARILRQADWRHFKEIAEYYLKTAATLKKRDIRGSTKTLLLRNSKKRLCLGIGCELLLKSFYLKSGYCVNKFHTNYQGKKAPIHRLSDLSDSEINRDETFTMNALIDNLHSVKRFQDQTKIKRGLQIAMVFRNKEGHVTFPTHDFEHNNYRDISTAVEAFYDEAFGQLLKFIISMKPKEKGVFRVGT